MDNMNILTANAAINAVDDLATQLHLVTEERDSWATRFRGLEADMRGMETMLTEERALNVTLTRKLNAAVEETAAWRAGSATLTPAQREANRAYIAKLEAYYFGE